MAFSRYVPGDIVNHEGKAAIVLGSYALLHARDMDSMVKGEDDVRFRDYRIMYLNNGHIPLTWIRESELTLVKEVTGEVGDTIYDRQNQIFDILLRKDRGELNAIG